MNCTEWQGRLDAYVDAELPAPEMDAFRAHAEKCGACAAMALALTESKLATRRAANRYTAAPESRTRVFDLVKGKAEPAQVIPERSRTSAGRLTSGVWLGWAVAAAVFLLITAGLFVAANRRNKAKALGEFTDLHVAALASANPVEVISTDRHTVKPWFQGKIPFTFDLPDLEGSPFTLVGGRVAYFHQEPGAQLVFRYQRHLISVFLFRETPALALPASAFADRTSSFSLQTWTQRGLRYVVIGDANPKIVQELAEQLHSAQ